MPTPKQLALIHMEAARVGLIDRGNRIPFDNLLRNVAGVTSSKFLNQSGFEDVMAVIEDQAESQGLRAGTYWRDKVRLRGTIANPRMTAKIHALAAGSRYALGAICERFSEGRADTPEQLHPREAWQLIEMLKACNAREAELASRIARQPTLFGEGAIQPLPRGPIPPATAPLDLASEMAKIEEEPF